MTSEINVRSLAFETLQDILNDKAYSNIVINEVLSEYEMTRADKGLLTELVYGTLKKIYLRLYLETICPNKIKRLGQTITMDEYLSICILR